ncbi:MAG: TRAP transporter small permease [Rhodospirillaceae bacterium]|jgi:TRAP-type C4-dicarboxylate transport system permease small subunit|nr:TRAP transporter small permease [Rhodospirillaceae bacterium]MBT7268262.1 TRAP transporter small permease [Rhodospirillaceae bacterium]
MSSETSTHPLDRIDKMMVPIDNAFNMAAAAAIFGMMILGVAQIGLRSIFNMPIVGYIDLVELSMATMAFLGAAYCQRVGAHIRMELLIGKLHGRALWLAETFGTLVALFIIGVLIYYSWGHFGRAYTLGDSTIDAEFPVWPSKLLVPIAFSLWFLRLTLQLVGSVRLVIYPDATPEGVVVMKDVAEQAAQEIHETFGDEDELSYPADGGKSP